ncbi:SGNH/GDSL hydrolase family protein [Lichenicola sp.]|uniref:SGNH/GDSL hydrolase family protein n=1 Tax=Lichenicola sp. TaxID=2804529 RepID=UPI003B006A5D
MNSLSRLPLLPRTHARHLGPSAPLRIVAFGSSTTEGSGSSGPAHTYPAVMQATLLPAFPGGIVLSNQGVGGDNAVSMDARLDAVLGAEPDLVVWQTGSNDPLQQVPLETFERLTRAGIRRLRATGSDLVLVDQQYCRALEECADFPPFLDALHRIAAEAGVPVFDRYRRMREWCTGDFTRDTLSPDGLHMADPGYALLGQAIAAWLLERV